MAANTTNKPDQTKPDNPTQNAATRNPQQLTYGHLIVTAILMLVVGWVFGRFSGGVLSVTQSQQMFAGAQSQAAPQAPVFDFGALEQATRDNPYSAGVWVTLANAYFDSSRYSDAINAYTRGLEIDDSNPNVWTDRGIMFRRSGNPEAAIRDFETAASVDPTHLLSRFNLGIVYQYDLKDLRAARRAYEEVLRLDPDFITPSGTALTSFLANLE